VNRGISSNLYSVLDLKTNDMSLRLDLVISQPVVEAEQDPVRADSSDGSFEGSAGTDDTSSNAADVSSTTAPPAVTPGKGAIHRGLRVLFLSSDTGGGHRASAESLGKQFQLQFPGTTYDLLDIVEKDGVPPYNSLVSYYKHLSSHPSQWKLVYSVSNSRAFEMLADAHLKLMCERAVRKSIKSYNPDVVVCVHPLMTNVPVLSCSKISNETGRHLPIFTVVTDLGSAHCLWFANGVEKMFVGSDAVKELAQVRGKVPPEKLLMYGLPIRHAFEEQADLMGDRCSEQGREYQREVRCGLGLSDYVDRKTILVMGGGEGCGQLANIVDALYVELISQGIDALVLVVCGRNMKLKDSLDKRDWVEVFKRWRAAKERAGFASTGIMALRDACGGGDPVFATAVGGCIEGGTVTHSIRRMLSRGSLLNVDTAVYTPLPESSTEPRRAEGSAEEEEKKADNSVRLESSAEMNMDNGGANIPQGNSLEGKTPGNVAVIGLGFVTQMAEYMVAADVLVSKAGPGTISEAAALSLPVMLTSFLPGQEEGNVDYVIDGGFGAYCADNDPIGIAEEVCMWLTDDAKMQQLSQAAKAKGAPHAARDIVQVIGDSTTKWIELNEEKAAADAAKKERRQLQHDTPSPKESVASTIVDSKNNATAATAYAN